MFMIRTFSIVKMTVLPNFIYMFDVIPVKIPAWCFVNGQVYSKIYIEKQGPGIEQTILKKNNVGRITLSDTKAYY